MKKKNDNISRRERSATVGLVLCFVAMIAVAGAVSFSQSKQRERLREQQRLAEAETERQNNTEEEETGMRRAQTQIPCRRNWTYLLRRRRRVW